MVLLHHTVLYLVAPEKEEGPKSKGGKGGNN